MISIVFKRVNGLNGPVVLKNQTQQLYYIHICATMKIMLFAKYQQVTGAKYSPCYRYEFS